MNQSNQQPIVFASAIWSAEGLHEAGVLAASLREFGGRYHDAPLWLYVPADLDNRDTAAWDRLKELNVTIKNLTLPEEAQPFFSMLVFASAAAEREAGDQYAILAFLDNDAVILREPDEFALPEDVSFGYRPVMHRNICPLFGETLDVYWKRVYKLLDVDSTRLFSVVTPADGDRILPCLNGGCLVVRPEHGLLRQWSRDFLRICSDSVILSQCNLDRRKWIFTFQAVLSATVINNVDASQRLELSANYNYPIFFREIYGAKNDFHDITGVAVIRTEGVFSGKVPDWDKILIGPADRIAWLKHHGPRK